MLTRWYGHTRGITPRFGVRLGRFDHAAVIVEGALAGAYLLENADISFVEIPATVDAFIAFRDTQAKVKEWVVGDAMSFIHDADVGEDEKLYGVDEGHDVIWELDRATGKVSQHKLPDIDLPQGGVFAGVQLPIGVFTGKHGPHSMAQAKDGRFWFTNALSSTIGSFDPVTKKIKLYDVGRTHLYPHTIRIDQEGIVWFTIVASNQIGRFDPKAVTFDNFDRRDGLQGNEFNFGAHYRSRRGELLFGGLQGRSRRVDGYGAIALALQQQAQCRQHIRLVVGNQDDRRV